MPEQAEFVGNTLTADGTYIDGDDYTWQAIPGGLRLDLNSTPLGLVINTEQRDCRTADEKMNQRMASLETAVQLLTDEVRHLREDVARMRTGESEL